MHGNVGAAWFEIGHCDDSDIGSGHGRRAFWIGLVYHWVDDGFIGQIAHIERIGRPMGLHGCVFHERLQITNKHDFGWTGCAPSGPLQSDE